MKLVTLLGFVLLTATLRAEESTQSRQLGEWLREGVEEIHRVWERNLKKPPLKHDRLDQIDLHGIYGHWVGTGKWREIAKVELRPHGTWLSDGFLPKVTNGKWFLIDGMLLLFDGPISEQNSLPVNAVIMRNGKLTMIHPEAPRGYVVLKKQRKAQNKAEVKRGQRRQ